MSSDDILDLVDQMGLEIEETLHEATEAIMLRVAEATAEHGQLVVGVGAGEHSPVPFAYTAGLGLAEPERPELAIYGLPVNLASLILNTCSDLMREGQVECGREILTAASVPLMPVRMTDVSDLKIAQVCWDGPVEAIQLVWPDKDLNWPWGDEHYGEAPGQTLKCLCPHGNVVWFGHECGLCEEE